MTSEGMEGQDREAVIARSRVLRARHFAGRIHAGLHAGSIGLGAATAIILIEFGASVVTGSLAIWACCADSGVGFVRIMLARRVMAGSAVVADEDYRFGHGKGEAMAALVPVAIAAVCAMLLVSAAIGHWSLGHRPPHAYAGAAALLVAAMVAVVRFALIARGIDRHPAVRRASRRRLCSTLAVVAVGVGGVLTAPFWQGAADIAAGVAIAVWIVVGAIFNGRAAIDQLMDREWPEVERQRFLDIVTRDPDVRGVHDFRTRSSGSRYFAQLHVVLRPNLSMAEAATIVGRFKADVRRHYENVEFFVHVDPEGHVDHPGDDLAEADVTPEWSRPRTDRA